MHQFIFGTYPYIALTVLLIGSVVRYERDPFTWKSSSSQLLRRKQLVIGSVLFHVGVLIIFFGHLGGLLTPIQVFDALGISHGAKQLLAVNALVRKANNTVLRQHMNTCLVEGIRSGQAQEKIDEVLGLINSYMLKD